MQDMPLPPKKPWHKTTGGVIFLSLLGIVFLIGFIFLGFVGYYSWQISQGNTGKLAEEFNPEFTKDPNTKTSDAFGVIVDQPEQYIHAANPTTGGENAPVQIIMFIDFECPYCQRSYPIVKELTQRYGDVIELIFKHFPLESIHPDALPAARGASCADDQGAFWPYYDVLFTSRQLDEASLLSHADTLGLDIQTFSTCLNSQKHEQEIEQDLLDGIDIGVRGTPTYVVNGIKIEGVLSKEIWDAVILEQLQK